MAQTGNPAAVAEQAADHNAARAARDARRDEVAEAAAEGNLEDFDAFWSATERKVNRTRIMGHDVILPPSLPLQFELEARKLSKSTQQDDVQRLVALLFGADAMESWAGAGMDLEQFQVLLAWAPRAIAGQPLPLAEVAAAVRKENARTATDDPEDGEADPT